MNSEQFIKPTLIRSYHYNSTSNNIVSTPHISLIPFSVLYDTYIKKHVSFINIIGFVGIFVFILGTFFQTSFLKNKLKKHEYRSTFKRT